MNAHEQRIEQIVAATKKLWDEGFVEKGNDTWETYQQALRQDLKTMSAAEIAETLAALK